MNKLFYIVIAFLMIGCASRHVNKSTDNTHINEVVKENTETKTTQLINERDSTQITTLEIEPIDESKEYTIDGKIYKNVRFKTRKIQMDTRTSENNNHSTQSFKISEKDTTTKKDNKDITKESGFNFRWYWWLVILIPILLYIEWKR